MSKAIPVLKDNRGMEIDFSTSLGGTIYGTTPGGTKRVYDRNTLLNYRNSPLSKTPPTEVIDFIKKSNNTATGSNHSTPSTTTPPNKTSATPSQTKPDQHDEMFQME